MVVMTAESQLQNTKSHGNKLFNAGHLLLQKVLWHDALKFFNAAEVGAANPLQ